VSVLYLVRHGQASFAADDYDQLSELGFEQSRILGDALRRRIPRVDEVVLGTMRRHRQTAEACLGAMGVDAPPIVIPELDEYDHDEVVFQLEPRWRDRALMRAELDREEEPRRAFQRVFEKAVARWTTVSDASGYPEPFPAFETRCARALGQLTEGLGHSKTVLVFTSGGPIALMMGALIGLQGPDCLRLQWRLVNTGVSKVVVGRTGPTVGSLNEHAHLEREAKRLITYR